MGFAVLIKVRFPFIGPGVICIVVDTHMFESAVYHDADYSFNLDGDDFLWRALQHDVAILRGRVVTLVRVTHHPHSICVERGVIIPF